MSTPLITNSTPGQPRTTIPGSLREGTESCPRNRTMLSGTRFDPGLLYQRFGVQENPFGVTPCLHDLYQSQTHSEAIASLIIGIECGVGFQTLIAPPGMGKTSLLFSLLEQFRDVARTAFLFQSHGNSIDFLRRLILELGDEELHSDQLNLQDKINSLLIRERQAGKRTIIVIDEAQSLDLAVLETVRLLSNFETPKEKLLQIVLAGQPQLAHRLASPDASQLYQRVLIRTTLVPFTLEDTRNYIEHRLKIAGYTGPPLFTPAAVKSIWERSRGVPREINTLCFNALLLAFAAGRKEIDSNILCHVVADLDLTSIPFNGDTRPNRNLGKQPTSSLRPETNPPTRSCDQSCEASASLASKLDVADIHSLLHDQPDSDRPDSGFIPISVTEPPGGRTGVVDSINPTQTMLLPLDLEGTRNYIEHRLKTSGYSGHPLFTPAAVKSIWERSHGVPRQIDTLCFNALLLATVAKRKDIDLLQQVTAALDPNPIPIDADSSPNGNRGEQSISDLRSEASPSTRTCDQSSEDVAPVSVATYASVPSDPTEDCVPKPIAEVGEKTGVINSIDAPLSPTHILEVPRGAMHSSRAWARKVLSVIKTNGHIPASATIAVLCSLLFVAGMWVQRSPKLLSPSRTALNYEPNTTKTAEDVLAATLPVAIDKLAGNEPNAGKMGNTVGSASSVPSGSTTQATRDDDSAGPKSNLILAQLIRTVKPNYPPAALDAHIEGSVVLEVLVDGNGTARHVRVMSGPSVLVPPAIDAVEHWVFRPSYLNGEPIESQVLVGVKFSLH